MPLTTTISLSLIAKLTAAGDIGTPTVDVAYSQSLSLATGVGANQADMIWTDQRTLAASATEDIDLAGVLTSLLGGTLTLVRVKFLYVFAATGNTNNVQVRRGATNGVPIFTAVSAGMDLKPGGSLLWTDPSAGGVAVTAGTGDLINFTNSGAGTSVTYDILVGGGLS